MLSTRDGSYYSYVTSYVCAALERRDDDDGSEVAWGSHDVLIERRVCLRVKKVSRVLDVYCLYTSWEIHRKRFIDAGRPSNVMTMMMMMIMTMIQVPMCYIGSWKRYYSWIPINIFLWYYTRCSRHDYYKGRTNFNDLRKCFFVYSFIMKTIHGQRSK